MAIPRPSRYILQKAWKLGQKMARVERRLVPLTFDAHQYPTYMLFCQAHRHRLEQENAMVLWDGRIAKLIEREGNAQGVRLDNPLVWDRFYDDIAAPIHSAFWYGWELARELPKLYEQKVVAHQPAADSNVLHVYTIPIMPIEQAEHSQFPDDAERSLWDSVAHKLFNEMDGDGPTDQDKLWTLPDADSVLGCKLPLTGT